LLAVFSTAEAMKEQCDSWLHYTALRVNQAIGEKGRFWQPEPFDHLVRSPKQYEYLRRYIADNPRRARLKLGEYYYRRRHG
jgi:type I restriction enzyme R subunit